MKSISSIKHLRALTLLLALLASVHFEAARAQMQRLTLATMSMNLEMLRETKDVWANMVLTQMSKITI